MYLIVIMKVFCQQMLLVVIVAIVKPLWASPVNALSATDVVPDFARAEALVEEARAKPGNIDYHEFCVKKPQGANKMACQMKDMNDVGLLVCLKSLICKPQLRNELDALEIIKAHMLNVVIFHDKLIDG